MHQAKYFCVILSWVFSIPLLLWYFTFLIRIVFGFTMEGVGGGGGSNLVTFAAYYRIPGSVLVTLFLGTKHNGKLSPNSTRWEKSSSMGCLTQKL